MVAKHQSGAGLRAEQVDALLRHSRRVDHIDEPARPLGTKRAALRIRRMAVAMAAAAANANANRPRIETVCLASSAAVAFGLRLTSSGLLVERKQQRSDGVRLVQTMVFADAACFERWCASEPIRFDDPVLYAQLRREGREAFDRKQ